MSFDNVKVMHEVVNLCLSEGNRGVPTLKACEYVANLIQQEVGAIGDTGRALYCVFLYILPPQLTSPQ